MTAGTAGDNGWYRSAVTAQLSVQGATDSTCPLVKTFRTSSDAVDCTATDGSSTVQFHLQFKIDTDAPAVTTATPDRAPDAGGWYSHPVTVTFSGNDTTSGIAGLHDRHVLRPRLRLGVGERHLPRQRGQRQRDGVVRAALRHDSLRP